MGGCRRRADRLYEGGSRRWATSRAAATCQIRGGGTLGLGLGLGLGLEQFFERRSGDRTRVDGFCDFEKVPPDQLCPSAKRD